MSVAQNEKIRQVTETTMVIGVDIARDTHWARAFDWRGLELSKAVKFENSAEGFHYFLCWASELAAEQKKGRIMVGLEPTGHYWFKVVSPNHLFYKGQIIYSKIRPLLRKAVIAPFDGLCSADMYPLNTAINRKYLLRYMLSDAFNLQVATAMSSRVKMPKIN